MGKYQSTKILEGYSICFRDDKQIPRLQKLYGGAISFKLWFEGELDNRNWVVDFGFLKRSKYKIKNIVDPYDNSLEEMSIKEYMDWLFDHTLIISENDSYLTKIKYMTHNSDIAQLRVLPQSNLEFFTKHVYNIITEAINEEHGDRIKISKIEGILQNYDKYELIP
jgi:6-pyruvoyltetrahydropterin/6-carboxytetrahydropterin synthase